MEDSITQSSTAGEEGPESWEIADVEASVRRLMLSSGKDSNVSCNKQDDVAEGCSSVSGSVLGSGLSSAAATPDDLINTVDQFLCEAIQNPRERLSVLRMEQEVERFIHDPSREQMEFLQLPTSYLRLAAHRVAQHYSLQSMVSLDNNLPDGSGSRIIIRKTSNIRIPSIRLADIPVHFPTEESGGALKVAIKQRPQKGSFDGGSSNNDANAQSESSSSKSVEERKEEYNKARARIFSSNSSGGTSSGKPVNDSRNRDIHQHGALKTAKTEDRIFLDGGSNVTISRSFSDSSASSSRLPKSRTDESFGRLKTNNRVAIFRDREVDRKDPDYDRSYDRYMQRFDPGFGFSGGSYTIQPMYVPAVNYNTEFPQLGSSHGPPISSELQPCPIPQHLPGPWVSPSSPAGIGYGPAEAMLSPFGPSHVASRPNSGLYLHSTQYPCQRSGLPYMHPLEPIHHSFSQSHQQQPDANFGLARPR